jgi:signal transduction histidine kinase/HD-GYP domain-containing protein (c-di-GMP phosphodiesterase class II)
MSMDLIHEAVQFGNTGMAGYLLLLGVLGGMAVYAAWRGWRTRLKGAMLSLVHAVLFFAVARALLWDYGVAVEDGFFPRVIIFSLLSIASFYFIALSVVRLEALERAEGERQEGGAQVTDPKLPDSLLREMLFVGLAAACLFAVAPIPKTATTFVLGFVNWLVVGATVRLGAFALARSLRKSRVLGPVIAVATLSWLLYEVLPTVGEGASFWALQAARWSDILALALAVAAVLGAYVRWGQRSEGRAQEKETEMETAKSELARLNRIAKDIYEDSNDLMIKQKQQALASMRRADGLEKVLQVGISIQQRRRLDDVLQMIVQLVHTHVGFKTVTLRLLNDKTESYEMRAHVGLDPQVRDRMLSCRVPVSEFEKIVDPRRRISKSYFISPDAPSPGDAAEEYPDGEGGGENANGEDSMLVQNGWGGIEMLVVPLVTEEGKTIGYLTVEDPDDPATSLSHVIEMLERIATLGVIGIHSANMFEALREKDNRLKNFTDKLSDLNKMKSNFVATMSHEFRTPLTSIKAYCDTLIKNADSVDRDLLKEFLFVIDEESGRLMTLVEDILDFSQIESGAMKFERRPCDVREVVADAASELAKNFELKEIAFHQELPAGKVVIQGEEELIKQLVVSLLHNASKFCKPKGNVWLRVEDEVAAARLIVEDDGVGIPEDQMEKVFDQFYQVDSSATREHSGSGLGLALCRSIVEWHNGRIWVQNMTGGGARFVAVIPKKQAITRSRVMGITSTVRRLEVERFLELVVESVSELMRASKVSLMLVDRETGDLRIDAAIGVQETVVEHTRVKVGEGISGRVAADRTPLLVKDIETDERVGRNNNEPVYGSKSFLCVPIVGDGEALGVVNVSSPVGRGMFTEKDRLLLEMLSGRLAVALDKVWRFKDVSTVYERVVEAYKAILESKRFVEAKDDDRMTALVGSVAKKLGVDAQTRAALPYLMAVYDLGLSGVGSHILNKPAGLSAKDREEIEKHTIEGADLLRAIEPESKVREIVLYHHENFDGTGYPGKLKADSIPIEARIIRVADSLKALISERPYQRRYSFEEAIEILRHRSGSFFDPKVVDAFIEVIAESTGAERPQPVKSSNELAQAGAPDPL